MKPGDIIIKDIDVLRGLMERNYHPILINIICAVAKEFGIMITESYREKRHSNDLHGVLPVQANDLRTWCYPNNKAHNIEKWINNKWEYDSRWPEMKVARIHDSGKGVHFHIQCHHRTRRRL